MNIKVITEKYGNCDALQLNATRRRVSRSGLQLRGPKCTGVIVQEFRNLRVHLMQSRKKLKRNRTYFKYLCIKILIYRIKWRLDCQFIATSVDRLFDARRSAMLSLADESTIFCSRL